MDSYKWFTYLLMQGTIMPETTETDLGNLVLKGYK